MIYDLVKSVNSCMWDFALLFLLVGTGMWFTFRLKFVQLRYLGKALKITFGNFSLKGVKPYALIVCVCIVLGCTMDVDFVWAMSDMFNGFMVIPNLLGLLAMTGVATKLLKEFEELNEKNGK